MRAASKLAWWVLAAAAWLSVAARAQRDDGCGRVLEAGVYAEFYKTFDTAGYQAFQAAACAHNWRDVRLVVGQTGCGVQQ